MVKRYVWIVIALVLVLGGYYAVNALFSTSVDIPLYRVKKGELLVSLNETGTVDAKRAVTLTAPRIRGLQITWLAPEGSMVKKGDPIIKFDATQQIADLADNQSDLKIKEAALERAKQEHTIQEKQLNLDLEKAVRNYDEKKHDAPRIAEEARLEKELAQLNYKAKLDQLQADVDKAEVEVHRARDKVNLSQRELDQMTMNAPIPGMVVYLEIWKGSSESKVQEGDSPWPGQGLVNLPDLSEMIVKTSVSEVDASKVDTGQAVRITLDAFPGHVYQGEVIKKGTLARKKDPNSKINVFDIEVAVLNGDERLKPGMSAQARIVISKMDSVLSVPLEAVFEKDGKTVVYMKNKDRRAVKLGRKNDMMIQILDGVDVNDEICLLDPTIGEGAKLPGEKATEPEINQDQSENRPQRQGGGRRGRPGR